ncbi:MAG: hypothetical protein M3040_12085 [Bacteroidota bacterium]|nr:hypothetical protein [Bacteroidota bacterium]
MVIGSHIISHPVLSKLSAVQQENEISQSFKFVEDVCIILPYKTFCYPYGGSHSFTNETERLLNNEGCSFSFNVEARDVSIANLLVRPQALSRYDCNYFPQGQL